MKLTNQSKFANLSLEQRKNLLVEEDMIKMLPLVAEANQIASELNKLVEFKMQLRTNRAGETQVMVMMNANGSDATWTWDKDKFTNRSYMMREMYQTFIDDGEQAMNEQWPQEKDPFFDPPEPQAVGTADVYLSSLSYLIEIEDDFTVVDHAGNELGNCAVEIWPLTASGAELDEDADMVDEPSELIGKSFKFKVKVKQVRGLPPKFKKDVHCRFKWYLEETVTETTHKDGQSPTLDFEKIYTVECVTKEFLDNFLNGSLQVEVWATQDAAAKSAMPGRVKSGDSAKVSKVKELIAAAKGAGAKVIDIADLEAALGN